MVAPIREIGNISSSTSTIYSITPNMAPNNSLNMIINSNKEFFKNNCNFQNEIRDHFLIHSAHRSKTLFMSSSECDEDYTTRVWRESNRIIKDNPIVPSNSSQLEYMTSNSQNNQVSKTADFSTNTRQ